MIARSNLLQKTAKRMGHYPVVVLLGPRQVGKTTLAKSISSDNRIEYFDLESPITYESIKIDIESFLNSKRDVLLILDEVQIVPEIFATLRSIIDKKRKNGSYLLLGSANPLLIKGVSESLAGRATYLELHPLNLSEVGYEHQDKHWFRGGFPSAYLAEDDEIFADWIIDYVRAYVERDINLIFNINLNSSLLKRLWTMLCHINSSQLNAADLGRSLGVSANTVTNYIDMLEAAFLIFRLQPWHVNVGKRLVKSPKIYLNDTGILHGLLNIKSFAQLQVHPIIGSSWENYVIVQIRSLVKDSLELYYYRTHNGSEVDLVLVQGITPIASIEIKNSNTPTPSKGFYISIEDLKTKRNFIITKNQTYHTLKGIVVCSLSDFLNVELGKIMGE